MQTAVDALNEEVSLALNYDSSITDEVLRSINDRLMFFERSFLTDDVRLTGYLAPFFRHTVLAPSKYDHYSGQAFSALKDAIIEKNDEEIKHLSLRFALIISGAAEALYSNPFL